MKRMLILLLGLLVLGGILGTGFGIVSATVEGGAFKIYDNGYAWNTSVSYTLTSDFIIQWDAIINQSKVASESFNVTIMQVNLSNGYGKMWIEYNPSETTVKIHYLVHDDIFGDSSGIYDTGIDTTTFFGQTQDKSHTYRIEISPSSLGSYKLANMEFYFDDNKIGSGSTASTSDIIVEKVGVYITQSPPSGGGEVYIDNIQGTGISGTITEPDYSYFDSHNNAEPVTAVPFFSDSIAMGIVAVLLAFGAFWFFMRQ